MIIDQNKYDEFAGRILSFFLIINIINIGVKQTFPTLPFIGLLSPALGLIYFMKLVAEYNYIRFINKKIILLEIIFIVLIIISIMRYPYAMNDIIKRYVWVIAFCVPLYSIASKVEDIDVMVEKTKKANMVIFLFSVFSFAATYIKDGGFTYENYNMTLGYTLLFPTLFHLNKARTRKMYIILFFIELIIISFYGSRGQLLCVFVYILISFADNKRITKGSAFLIFGMATVIFLLCGWPIIGKLLLSPIVEKTGSRTLSMLMRGKILSGSGRMDIWKETIANISEKPILGWGLGGEFSYLHSYPHNIFLELCLHFGAIIGLVLSIAILVFIVFRIVFGYRVQQGLVLLFCSFVCPLLLSGTYTEAPVAWMVVGYGIAHFVSMNGTTVCFKMKKI